MKIKIERHMFGYKSEKIQLAKSEIAILKKAIEICEKGTELYRKLYFDNDPDADCEIEFALAEMHLRSVLEEIENN